MLEARGDVTAAIHELTTRLCQADLSHLIAGTNANDLPKLQGNMQQIFISPHAALRLPHSAVPQAAVFHGVPASLTLLHEHLAVLANGPRANVSILILRGDTPLERYLLHYPAVCQTDWLQEFPLNPSNPQIACQHLLCAASELVLEAGERYPGLHNLGELIHQLAAAEIIEQRQASRQWVVTQPRPHPRVRLRSYEPAFSVVHQHDGRLLTRLAPQRAFREAFEGAVLPYAGQTFRAERYLADQRRIVVRPIHRSHLTRGMFRVGFSEVNIEAAIDTDALRLTYGTLSYTQILHGFERLDTAAQTRPSIHVLTAHQQQYRTQAVRIELLPTTAASMQNDPAALHPLIHAVLTSLRLILVHPDQGMRGGLEGLEAGGASTPVAVFVDLQAGVNGAIACLYRAYERALRIGLQFLLQCDCEHGCKRCVSKQDCDACGVAGVLDRQASIRLLQQLLGEVAPALETVQPQADETLAKPSRQADRVPRHLYLCLTTQKRANDVGGWQHKHLLGLAVAMTYDTSDQRYRVYTAQTVDALLRRLQAADLVIGFNLRDFDYQVLQAYTDAPLSALPTLAILDDVQQTLGFGVSLGHLLQATLGRDRLDDSMQTVGWFREGVRDRIVAYCRRDLELLQELIRYGTRKGTIAYRDRSGQHRTLRVNWQGVEHDG
ncbi:hypothetical protein NKDENANG_02575 [Candidatus Entotheonellaceae bacterium PAL068K]